MAVQVASAVEDDALSGFSSSADRESAGSAAARLCGRRSATDRRPRRCRHCAAPFPAPLCALGGSVAFRQLRAAAAAQLLPPQSRARAEQHSLLLLMSCQCVSALRTPTSGGTSCLCAHRDARARRARRGARMSF
eukprot:6294669-Prymnesium_polylepis.4